MKDVANIKCSQKSQNLLIHRLVWKQLCLKPKTTIRPIEAVVSMFWFELFCSEITIKKQIKNLNSIRINIGLWRTMISKVALLLPFV